MFGPIHLDRCMLKAFDINHYKHERCHKCIVLVDVVVGVVVAWHWQNARSFPSYYFPAFPPFYYMRRALYILCTVPTPPASPTLFPTLIMAVDVLEKVLEMREV